MDLSNSVDGTAQDNTMFQDHHHNFASPNMFLPCMHWNIFILLRLPLRQKELLPSHLSFFLYWKCNILLVIKLQLTWRILHNALLLQSMSFVLLPKGKEKISRCWCMNTQCGQRCIVERGETDSSLEPFLALISRWFNMLATTDSKQVTHYYL